MKIKTAPNDIETAYVNGGFSPVAGMDEAGRGPLAGPVVCCALILPEGLIIEGVNDSKKVPEKRRVTLAARIKEAAVSYALGIIGPEEIDRLNILQATLRGMVLAIEGLSVAPRVVLIDGTTPPHITLPFDARTGKCRRPQDCRVVCIPQGDLKSHLIAAASILAKVERDKIMLALHEEYPMYSWDKNKGYGTPAHMAAIRGHGLSPAHRRSFCGAFL